tara:strand:- start:2491 stop:2685 length:195 start_codon:yes stop_codon:yes gene_type:complete
MPDKFKWCGPCNDNTIHVKEACMCCEPKRKAAAKFFNSFDFDNLTRNQLRAVKHAIQNGDNSYE